MTHDSLHVTTDTKHLTCNLWWEVNIIWTFQGLGFYVLGVKVNWRFGGKGSVSLLINYKGVCKTDLATPGLLITSQVLLRRIVIHIPAFVCIGFFLYSIITLYVKCVYLIRTAMWFPILAIWQFTNFTDLRNAIYTSTYGILSITKQNAYYLLSMNTQ